MYFLNLGVKGLTGHIGYNTVTDKYGNLLVLCYVDYR